MKKVSLELSPEQFKELLKLVYVGDWVIDEPDNAVLNELVQTIFKKSEDVDLNTLVEYDKESDLYLPSLSFDEEVIDIIDDFEDECFWDHLIYRLAERDLDKKLGNKAKEMSFEDKMEQLDPLTEKYMKEFEESGLDNVNVKLG